MINILDAVIILGLLLGAVIGFKRGIIQSVVMFVGTILVIVLSYLLKNYLSVILYTYLPFFNFSGSLEGVSVINILIYEGIAFLITFAILMLLLRILIKVTGIIEKVLKWTIILGIPSKIFGALFGVLEAFAIIFVGLFVLNQFHFANTLTQNSKFNDKILTSTPLLSNAASDIFNSVEEIYELQDDYDNSEEYNRQSLEILLKNEVITPDSVRTLIKKDKIKISNVEEILSKYE